MTFGGGFDAILRVGREKDIREKGSHGVGRRADNEFQDFLGGKEKVRDVLGDKVKSRSYGDKGFHLCLVR